MKIGDFEIGKVYFVVYKDYASFVAMSRDAETTAVLTRKLYDNKRERILIDNDTNIPIYDKKI